MSKDWIHGEKRISWMWIFRDLLFRITLYLFVPYFAIRFFGLLPEDVGIVKPTGIHMLIASLLAVFAFVLSLYFLDGSRRRRHLSPVRDFWFSIYLLLINSPTEELFYRGFLMIFFKMIYGNFIYGLVISSILFGLQHFLFFGASPKSVLFDTFGGFFLGFAYLYLGKSLIPVILIHGVSNLALFTVGGYILKKWRLWET